MTPTEIDALLVHKAEIDRRQAEAMNMGSYERWIADALEALLKTAQPRVAAATQSAGGKR